MARIDVREIEPDSDWSALLAQYDACGWGRPSKGRRYDQSIVALHGDELICSMLFRVAKASGLPEAWAAKYENA